jgi:hypothetical protein
MKWIPITKPAPVFIIHMSDLTAQVKNEFNGLATTTVHYILKETVGRLFENLDFDRYHLSIAKNLKVRLER